MSNTEPFPSIEIESGRQLYRVLRNEVNEDGERRYTALDPNPFYGIEWLNQVRARYEDGEAVSGRFAPFQDSNGKAVPALYLASLKETAYFEVILRPLSDEVRRELNKKTVESFEAATVTFESSLKLADCRKTYLKGETDEHWPYSFKELFLSSQMKCMDNARSLAKTIHDTHLDVDGIVWDSVQHGNTVPIYMLFGHRRNGAIVNTVKAINDIPTWKPYLRTLVEEDRLLIAPCLAALL